MDSQILILTVGLVCVLSLATSVGFVLGRRTRTDESRAVVANLNARINAWWVMVAVCVVAFVFGKSMTLVLFAVTSFCSLREFISITPTRPEDHRSVVAAFYLFIPLQYWLIADNWMTMLTILIPVWAFLLLPVLSVIKGETEDFLPRIARIQWALMLCVFCISHVPALLMLQIPGYDNRNVMLLFFLVVTVQLSDVMQYVFGKILGRHKVAPKVSPSKTWEGLIGGGITATAAGTALWWITPFAPWQAAALTLSIVLAGFFGGLVLSAIKRSLGAKDWGTMIEGHGGMLDRMDSVSFAAPVFFHLVKYFFAA